MKALDSQLSGLRERVITMGNVTLQMVSHVDDVLARPQDETLLREIFRQEEELDRLQVDIDHLAMQLLVLYCPVAADLRMLMSVSRLTVELERMGDQVVNLCQSLHLLPGSGHACLLPEIQELAQVVKQMVADTLEAFIQGDSPKAQSIIQRDLQADTLSHRVVEQLLSGQTSREEACQQPDLADALVQVLIARALERIGDLATNICEEVVYTVKGQDIRHLRSVADPLAVRSAHPGGG